MIHFSVQSQRTFEKGLSALNSFATVFLLFHATTDDEESRSYEQFNALNISNPISRHRFLFYQTSIGKIAIIRQLKSQLHVDFESNICTQIAPHIKSTILIDDKDHKSSQELPTCRKIRSLDELILMTWWRHRLKHTVQHNQHNSVHVHHSTLTSLSSPIGDIRLWIVYCSFLYFM